VLDAFDDIEEYVYIIDNYIKEKEGKWLCL
jgi:hypothetical protein